MYANLQLVKISVILQTVGIIKTIFGSGYKFCKKDITEWDEKYIYSDNTEVDAS